MNQFSDSETSDSEDGIRFKTDNVRTNTSYSRKETKIRETSRSSDQRKRSRRRDRSFSRSRSSSKDRFKRSKRKREKRSRTPIRKKNKTRKEKKSLPCHTSQSPELKKNSFAITQQHLDENGSKTNENLDLLNNDSDVNEIKKSTDENLMVGPALPPHMLNKDNNICEESNTILNKDNILSKNNSNSLEGEDSLLGPKLPSHTAQKEVNKIIGPALPPHLFGANVCSEESNVIHSSTMLDENCDDEEDEDVYGPLPVDTASKSSAHIALEERALQMKIEMLNPNKDVKDNREQWMIELPDVKRASLGLGPRQFRANAGPDMSDRSSWTDTPSDKEKKIVDGKISTADLKKVAELKETANRDLKQEEIIKHHKKKRKDKSLLELHQDKLKKDKKKLEDNGNTRRPFSRDIDLKVNQFDNAQKKSILKKAQLLDDRFSKGQSKYL